MPSPLVAEAWKLRRSGHARNDGLLEPQWYSYTWPRGALAGMWAPENA